MRVLRPRRLSGDFRMISEPKRRICRPSRRELSLPFGPYKLGGPNKFRVHLLNRLNPGKYINY